MDFTTRYTYNFPTKIRFGAGVIDELASYLKENGLSRPMFVTDKALSDLDIFKTVISNINSSGLSSVVFTDIAKNPVKSNVASGKKLYLDEAADCVIGFGGGASMDVARSIVLWAHHDRDLFDFDDALGGDKYVTGKIPHFICVPTTSGTGSEVGRSAVISEDETKRKRILFSPRLLPPIVFADPALTLGLPATITAATGVDALTHNIEAYVAKGFNPLCDGIAIEGIKLVHESLLDAVKNSNIENRSKMMMASLMGATAFQKGLGVVHSLAHPLSTKFDTHHGLANAIMLPYGIDYNADISRDRFEFLAKLIGESSLKGWVLDLNNKLELPKNLSAIGITNDDIEALSELAIKDPCHPSNPRACTQEDFRQIYAKAINE